MAITITIHDVKGIHELKFEVPARQGLYLLTGINGCGKTSLLASLYRMGNPNAFKELLKHSGGEIYDKCDGSIRYSINNNEVTYTRKNIRWVPSPRKNTSILNQTNFSSVSFFPPSGERLYVHDEDLVGQRQIMAAEDWLKSGLNEVFATQKFSNLRRVRIQEGARGRRASNRLNIAYLIRHNNKYYTEKNFSFGEILVLNLLLKLHNIPNNGLLLIDELEIALYPKALVALYKYLEQIAINKQITIIISTHSASLINIAKRIILLEPQNDGTTNVIYDCSVARALGEIALQDDILPDAIIFVEDIMAKYYIKAIIKKINADTVNIPDYRVIAIGPYTSVVQFHKQTRGGIFTCRTKLLSLLDKDVETDALPYHRSYEPQSNFILTYHELEDKIKFLPSTPEVGICQYIEQDHINLTVALKAELENHQINITACIRENIYIDYQENIRSTDNQIAQLRQNGENKATACRISELLGHNRKICKKKYDHIVAYLCNVTQESEESINKVLFKYYIDWWQQSNFAEYNKFKGTVLSRIR